MNTKQKGNIAIGKAISYFTGINSVVSIPINDSQDYDLIVERDTILYKVQVKYTASKAESGKYLVPLRSISGSSRKEYGNVINGSANLLFIYTENGLALLIPIEEITVKTTITVTDKIIEKYKVSC